MFIAAWELEVLGRTGRWNGPSIRTARDTPSKRAMRSPAGKGVGDGILESESGMHGSALCPPCRSLQGVRAE